MKNSMQSEDIFELIKLCINDQFIYIYIFFIKNLIYIWKNRYTIFRWNVGIKVKN